jgi:hypothetical protein
MISYLVTVDTCLTVTLQNAFKLLLAQTAKLFKEVKCHGQDTFALDNELSQRYFERVSKLLF